MIRRKFLKSVAGGVALALSGVRSLAVPAYAFTHGVASGDPLDDRVILWTRVSGASGERVAVDWQVARDRAMRHVLRAGRVHTSPQRDYTVKIDVDRLPAGTSLYYRFTAGRTLSPLGTTRTLRVGDIEQVRLAVVTCSNYPAGFFHAYREIASRNDLDAVVHLGDYLYEYGPGEYATEYAGALGRVPEPAHELLSLQDYRARHAQYKADPDSMAMHARHPLIAVWDDHEIANEAWHDGADNHDAGRGEGRWQQRRDAAIRAYFEWMPVRGIPQGRQTRVFRDFRFGTLLSLLMLDTRHYARDRQPDIAATDGSRGGIEALLENSDRRMLGDVQRRWLRQRLAGADTTWQAIGQQVLVSPVYSPDLEPLLDLDKPSTVSPEYLRRTVALSKVNPPTLLDTWNGYPRARRGFLQDLEQFARNPIVLSGDLHTSLAGDLSLEAPERVVAVELMPSSVTSPGFEDYLPERRPGAVRDATLAQNVNLRYMETKRRGWLHVTFTKGECTAEWHLLDSIVSPGYVSAVDRRLSVRAGHIDDGLYEA